MALLGDLLVPPVVAEMVGRGEGKTEPVVVERVAIVVLADLLVQMKSGTKAIMRLMTTSGIGVDFGRMAGKEGRERQVAADTSTS